MKKLFEISSEERQRILEMHETATKNNYLSEQPEPRTLPLGGTSPEGMFNGNKLTPVIKNQESLNKFIQWPNTPTLNKSSLQIVGLRKAVNDPTITGGGGGEKPKHNAESLAFRLIGDYLTFIAKIAEPKDVKSLCSATYDIRPIKGLTEKKFKESFGAEDLKYLYQYFGGEEIFANAVKKAVKEQMGKSGVCKA